MSVGDIVETEPGIMEGPTVDGVEYRVNFLENNILDSFDDLTEELPGGGFKLLQPDSQFVMVAIIPELNTVHGRSEVEIIAFAPFLITGWGDHEVYGVFLNEALIVTEGPVQPVGEGEGIKVIRLVE